jgi:hypothetical protein
MPRRYILGPTLYEGPRGASFKVRIADDLRKATVFLGEEIADDKGLSAIDARATGFFVVWASDSTRSIEGMEPETSGIYLITARHVAVPLGTHFAIRFNKKGGRSDIILIEDAEWVFHPDKTVDVAVLHCGYPDWADCVPIPGRLLAKPTREDTLVSTIQGDELIFNDPNLGVGDIAYVVGLFHLLKGKKVNLPVVHTGHIALLPEDERIPTKDRITGKFQEVEGYLVEAHGLSGLSGGPVFARTSSPAIATYQYPRELVGGEKLERPVIGRLHSFTVLLGLWSASWDGEPDDVLADDKNLKRGMRVPVGMGVVVPSYKIAETLNSEQLVRARREEYQRRLDETAATNDILAPSSFSAPDYGKDENPRHKEDFTSLLNAAAKAKPQDDQT